jgi:hypothetical protein
MLSYFNTCKNIVLAELIVYKQTVIDKIINIAIWAGINLVIASYIMPQFGLSCFGPMLFGGVIAAVGLFELYANIVDFISDLTGPRIISYQLTLPIPSTFVLASKAIYYFITYVIMTSTMVPFGYICLWNQAHLMNISYFKLILAILFQSAFYACFVLWASSMTRAMVHLGSVWRRLIFPMWFLGGFQFSWLALYRALPTLAYVNALNPMIYITECTRIALLGQEGFVNFWLCLAAITGFSVICWLISIYKLKKRLDFV